MSHSRLVLGEMLFRRLCDREQRKVGFGASGRSFARLGLADPWQGPGAAQVGEGNEVFGFLRGEGAGRPSPRRRLLDRFESADAGSVGVRAAERMGDPAAVAPGAAFRASNLGLSDHQLVWALAPESEVEARGDQDPLPAPRRARAQRPSRRVGPALRASLALSEADSQELVALRATARRAPDLAHAIAQERAFGSPLRSASEAPAAGSRPAPALRTELSHRAAWRGRAVGSASLLSAMRGGLSRGSTAAPSGGSALLGVSAPQSGADLQGRARSVRGARSSVGTLRAAARGVEAARADDHGRALASPAVSGHVSARGAVRLLQPSLVETWFAPQRAEASEVGVDAILGGAARRQRGEARRAAGRGAERADSRRDSDRVARRVVRELAELGAQVLVVDADGQRERVGAAWAESRGSAAGRSPAVRTVRRWLPDFAFDAPGLAPSAAASREAGGAGPSGGALRSPRSARDAVLASGSAVGVAKLEAEVEGPTQLERAVERSRGSVAAAARMKSVESPVLEGGAQAAPAAGGPLASAGAAPEPVLAAPDARGVEASLEEAPGLIGAIARARRPEDILKAVQREGRADRAISSELPARLAGLVDRVVRSVDRASAESAEGGSRPMRVSRLMGRSPSQAYFEHPRPVGGDPEALKLAGKLQGLIGLAERDRAAAQAQVRMAADTSGARSEGKNRKPEDGKSKEPVSIQGLQRDVVESVLRELEMNLSRNLGDPDGWW